MSLVYDPEYREAVNLILGKQALAPPLHPEGIDGVRNAFALRLSHLGSLTAQGLDVEHTEYPFTAYDGKSISLHHFNKVPADSDGGPTSAILHIHGGGMITGNVEASIPMLATQVSKTRIPVFSVEYRLAPENVHPTPVEDCFAALHWLYNNATRFNVDKKRVAVMGESAGGGLAAGLTLLARDRGLSPPLAKQILIYPMLDDRTTRPNPTFSHCAVWTYDDNLAGWAALLGSKFGTDDVSPYAAPARAVNLSGLPKAYIDVGGRDIFRDEDLAYASRLAAAGLDVEFHLYPGVPHAFEFLAPSGYLTQRAIENRWRAIQTI